MHWSSVFEEILAFDPPLVAVSMAILETMTPLKMLDVDEMVIPQLPTTDCLLAYLAALREITLNPVKMGFPIVSYLVAFALELEVTIPLVNQRNQK